MSKRKKVIAALSECNPFNQCYEERCPYYKDNNCLESLHEDILKLLKEQEPVAPTHSYSTYRCGKCGHIVGIDDIKGVPGYKNRHCADCGREVKWHG